MIPMVGALKKTVYGSLRVLAGVPWLSVRYKNLCQYYIRYCESYSYNMYENGEYQILKHLYQNKGNTPLVFFDVGANKGDWSKLALRLAPGAHIHCFEPCRETFQTLSVQLDQEKRVTKNNFGLSDVRARLKLNNFGHGSGMNSFVPSSFTQAAARTMEDVEVITAKEYIDSASLKHIDFLKIDVEGWDYNVLLGLGDLLHPDFVPVIQFEYGYAHGDVKILMKDFYDLLESKGYKIGKLKRDKVEFSPFVYYLNNFEAGPNFIACHADYQDRLSKFL